jgi:outer membrane lipoprotein carrier protein
MPLMASDALTSQQQQEVVTSINRAADRIESMTCRFVQTKSLPMLNDKMVSEGKMSYVRPNKLYWEYTTPYQYLFIFNDTKVRVENSKRNDVIDTNSNKVFREVARIMMNTVTGKSLSNATDFDVTLADVANRWKVTLVPKKREMKSLFAKIVLSFDKSNLTVTQIDIFEKNNSETSIRLSDINLNKSIDESLFAID